ncbi:unnamed protein product [Polarella glacialis]|uniref:Myosin motor domain-containing protein n=1 Tax=Polarella glacialis TaxID=89957 RepID=A0A813E854_POLGL|nr:unnamed protein product [Polarella glacialis]
MGSAPPQGTKPNSNSNNININSNNNINNNNNSNSNSNNNTGSAKPKSRSATFRFRTSLQALMAKICAADNHYVRCIKPNLESVALQFAAPMVHEQLLYSGVLEAVHIRQKGFSSRLLFADFVLRYCCVATVRPLSGSRPVLSGCFLACRIFRSGGAEDGSAQAARQLLVQLRTLLPALPEGEIVFGKSKLFIKEQAVGMLESARAGAFLAAVLHTQRLLRGAQVRRALRDIKPVLREIRCWLGRCRPSQSGGFMEQLQTLAAAELELAALDSCVEAVAAVNLPVGLPIGILQQAARAQSKVRAEVEALRGIQVLLSSGSTDLEAMAIALADARELHLPSTRDELQLRLEDRIARIQAQLPLVCALREVSQSGDLSHVSQILTQIAEAGLVREPQLWIPELHGQGLLQEVVGLVGAEEARWRRREAELVAAAEAARVAAAARATALERAAKLAEAAKQARAHAAKLGQEAQAALDQASLGPDQTALAAAGSEQADSRAPVEFVHPRCNGSLQVIADFETGRANTNSQGRPAVIVQIAATIASAAEKIRGVPLGEELAGIADLLRAEACRGEKLAEEREAECAALRAGRGSSVTAGSELEDLDLDCVPHAALVAELRRLSSELGAERLLSRSLRAELETVRNLRGTGLLIT